MNYYLLLSLCILFSVNSFSQSISNCSRLEEEGALYEALYCYKQEIKEAENKAEIYQYIAALHLSLDDANEAYTYIHYSIYRDSLRAPAYGLRGFIWLELNNVDKAIKDFTHALFLDPLEDSSLLGMVISLEKKFKWSQVKTQISYCDRAIIRNPDSSYAYFRRAVLKLDSNDSSGCEDLSVAKDLGSELAAKMILEFCK